jgi:hypothetical protein
VAKQIAIEELNELVRLDWRDNYDGAPDSRDLTPDTFNEWIEIKLGEKDDPTTELFETGSVTIELFGKKVVLALTITLEE